MKFSRVLAGAALMLLLVELLRIGMFLASGYGLIALGQATGFSIASVLFCPALFSLVAVWRRWLAVNKTRDLLLLAAATASLVVAAFVLNSSALRGVDFFRLGFEASVRKELSTGALRAWADSKLRSTGELQEEQNVRLKQDEIPTALRQLRKWSEPSAVLVYGSSEKRWVFLRVKWREAFAEWGIMFTDKGDDGLDHEAQLRKLGTGTYTFFE